MSFLPLVSVIVTNYNHAGWVAQRIDSVLNQSYQHIELIILDDASTDNSRDVLNTYLDNPAVKAIVYNEKNTGSPFRQWKKAFEMIRGDIVWIAESDDFSHPALLETLVPAFEDPDCVLAHCEVVMVNSAGKPLFDLVTKQPLWYRGNDFLEQKMTLYDSLYNTGQVIFRRTALAKVSQMYHSYKLSGDYRLFCEIIVQGKVFASGLPHAFFRKHSNEMTSKYLGTYVHHQEHLEMVDWLIEKGVVEKEIVRVIAQKELVRLYCIRKDMSPENYRQLILLFKTACNKHQLSFPNVTAMWKSLRMKGNHFYRTKIRKRIRS